MNFFSRLPGFIFEHAASYVVGFIAVAGWVLYSGWDINWEKVKALGSAAAMAILGVAQFIRIWNLAQESKARKNNQKGRP